MTIKAMFTEIRSFLDEYKNKYNVSTEALDDNGEIVYANGNDGTDFDWKVNDRLCEFGYGINGLWAFKLHISRYGRGTLYCYPNGEYSPIEEVNRDLFSDDDAKRLMNFCYKHADKQHLWDCPISEFEPNE